MNRRVILVTAGVLVALAAGLSGVAAADPGAPDDCAATPPADYADPDGDPLGWEQGYWYDEQLDIDQSDGLTEEEIDAVVARSMARVEATRCLEFREDVPVDVWNRSEFQDYQNQTHHHSDSFARFDNAKFEALFLIGEDKDSIAVQQHNAGSTVLGFYTSANGGQIVLISDENGTVRINEPVLGHELVHALQEQHFETPARNPTTRSSYNGRTGLFEGDASFVDHRYETACNDGTWNCVSTKHGSLPSVANYGVYTLNMFPYLAGQDYVAQKYLGGGWDAVNEAYGTPPESGAAVLAGGEHLTTEVTLADDTTGNWERVRPAGRPDYATVGEATISVMFGYTTYDDTDPVGVIDSSDWNNHLTDDPSNHRPITYSTEPSDGWAGDRMHVYVNDDGALAYVWRIEFESATDAREFTNHYHRLLGYWNGSQVGEQTYQLHHDAYDDAIHVDSEGTTVTVVNAPTPGQLDDVRTDVTVNRFDEPRQIDHESSAGDRTNRPAEDAESPSRPGSEAPTDALLFAVTIAALLGIIVAAREVL